MGNNSTSVQNGFPGQGLIRLAVPETTAFRLRYLTDLAVLVWIGWFAWHHAGFLLRDDLYLYGDHPGQFYRLWQLLAIIWPEERWFIGWSPYWYAGYPELQFYPPGFALAGWVIYMGSFQKFSVVAVYQNLVFLSFILPGIGFYLLMARGLNDRLAGLVGAWLAMTVPFPLGGVLGVFIGLVGERLAFGLMPILILSGLWLRRAEQKAIPWLITGLILAWIMILHPYQTVLPAGVLGLYALLRGQSWQVHLRWLVLTVLLAFGLTAFWWFPLALHSQFFIPLIEAPLPEIRSNLEAMWTVGMAWLLAAALLGSLTRQGRRRWLPPAILLAGSAILGFIFFDYVVLIEQFNFFALDPVRLIAGVTFALLSGLALGLSELAWVGVRLVQRRSWDVLGLPLVLIVPWLAYTQVTEAYDFAEWMRRWQPGPEHTPIFLREAEAQYDLAAVWAVMANTPGRVLFTSHYGLLYDIPTSIKAATPMLSGREIVGGTFTHRTPVGSYLWTGQTRPPVLRGKVEHQDDKTLAGISWQSMNEDFLHDLARRFNVTLIVTTAADSRASAFLSSSTHFRPIWSNQLLTFYDVSGYEPTWIEAEHAAATVSRYARRAIDVDIVEAKPGASLTIKVANYALWRAEIAGSFLPIETNDYGLMTLALPPGRYTVHFRYVRGWPEWLGTLLSLFTFLGASGLVLHRRINQAA